MTNLPQAAENKPNWLTYLPISLVYSRFLISPFLVWDALDGKTSIWFIICYITAFGSDIFDGVIARRLGVSNAKLRQADSWADVTLYVCIATSAWLAYKEFLIANKFPLLMVIFAQLTWWIVNLVKYGKPASYHTYSAKIWGITLLVAIVALFGFDRAQIPLWVSCIVGTVHSLEEIAMTLILPTWTHDVLSIFHALQLRRELNH